MNWQPDREDVEQTRSDGVDPREVFAGLWEGWKPPGSEDWIRTCTIITGEPNDFVREIHTRMPVILPEDKLDAWLSGEAGKEILVPYPVDEMTVWPISPRVNSPKNDDPEILEPVVVVPNQPTLDRDSMLRANCAGLTPESDSH